MSGKWQPGNYRDEFRENLRKVIEKRLKSKGVTTTVEDEDERTPENATTNVVDFMSLLKKSIADKQRTPAKKTASKKAAKKTVAKKAAAKKAAPKKAAKKSAPKAPAKRRRSA
jgi:DNA end-binding protein Ku